MEIIAEPAWENLRDALLLTGGIAVILGATDSGKSLLAKYLVQRLVELDTPICLIDADVGQSSLGLPGTLCMKTFSSADDLDVFTYEKMSFVGTINPATNIAQITATVKKMSDACRERTNLCLVDTSGLVAGEIGQKLKSAKIKALNPEHIIAVQKERELEHILELISDRPIHRINASKNIKVRPLATRIKYRRKKYENYFIRSMMNDFILSPREATFLYKAGAMTLNQGVFKKGTVIGLNHDDDTIALGLLEDISDDVITFSSPIDTIKYINRVVFGDITI